ncbi:MAG: hypothetical protein BM564_08410 [Bacteroidetes bacterium MedPE-SWsnd-G2]|nr:MAG: hypothetical protein BM564_08410 [Bacteroidetes bacterium MedPE-SWsnd-G2]
MSLDQKDNLFLLVKSLTKSEKRQFKLYVGRLGVNSDSKFLYLFGKLDKAKTYDEQSILKSKLISKQQLANVKAHLYKQILISLRLSPSHQDMRLQIREQLDFATILYHKGLYTQGLKVLGKAKEIAFSNEEKNLAFEIVEMEKIIESQYITRSITSRVDELTQQAEKLSDDNKLVSKLSNLSLQLYGIFLKTGYVKNEEESQWITQYFNERFPAIDYRQLGLRERIWLYKVKLWYGFLLQDFLSCYRYAYKWVDLFYTTPKLINLHPVFYLKGNNYLLETLLLIRRKSQFDTILDRLKMTMAESQYNWDDNVKALSFLYLNLNSINRHFIDGTFNEGMLLIPEIESKFSEFSNRIDEHHFMTFYYKFASLNFGAGNNKACITYLDKIISNKSLKLREDLLCFARVLNLVAHYEAGDDYHIESLLKSTYKFLIKMNELHAVQREMIKFIKGLQDIYPQDLKKAFTSLHATLKTFENHPYERRAFLYLDIISWLESKIYNTSIQEVIKAKYLESSDYLKTHQSKKKS